MSNQETMIETLRILADDNQSGSDVVNAFLRQAADMIESLAEEVAKKTDLASENTSIARQWEDAYNRKLDLLEKAEKELAAEREKRQELIKVHEGLHSSFECLLSDFRAEKVKLDEAIRRVEKLEEAIKDHENAILQDSNDFGHQVGVIDIKLWDILKDIKEK